MDARVAKQFANDEALNKTPIAFISGGAESEVADKMRPVEISFLAKPFEMRELIRFVREHVREGRVAAPHASSAFARYSDGLQPIHFLKIFESANASP